MSPLPLLLIRSHFSRLFAFKRLPTSQLEYQLQEGTARHSGGGCGVEAEGVWRGRGPVLICINGRWLHKWVAHFC